MSGSCRVSRCQRLHHAAPPPSAWSRRPPRSRTGRKVLRLAAVGRRAREIAEQRLITERTVKAHFTAILTKLNASRRATGIARAPAQGLMGAAR
ncbi:response regulator transcription factor [Symbiobacterium terraclitae]|uniref:response regulator transcription factor n=1 Tax=Symbiobacterium terraclitae TaxID=557451 RepID=UPI0035B510E6